MNIYIYILDKYKKQMGNTIMTNKAKALIRLALRKRHRQNLSIESYDGQDISTHEHIHRHDIPSPTNIKQLIYSTS